MATSTAKRPLSRDRVIAAAVAIADAEGPEGVTMRRLAEELGAHPTSLYNHVDTKDAILDGIADALLGETHVPSTVETWQDWVRALAHGLRDVARAHPGAFLVLTQRSANGPVASEVTEAALDAFCRDGFSIEQASTAVAAVSLSLLGVALNECPPINPMPEPHLDELPVDRFPRLHEAMAAVSDVPDTGPVWELVVDGLIAALSRRAS